MCTRLKLPKRVNDILTKPKGEDSWDKLEQLRCATNSVVEGDDYVLVENAEETTAIGNSVLRCDRGVFADDVGSGCKLPAGCRVRLDGDPQTRAAVAAQLIRGRACQERVAER